MQRLLELPTVSPCGVHILIFIVFFKLLLLLLLLVVEREHLLVSLWVDQRLSLRCATASLLNFNHELLLFVLAEIVREELS